METLLSVHGLRTSFFTPVGEVHAVDGVSFELHKGEVLGIVGESGSGKSVTMLSVLRLLGPNGRVVEGSLRFRGQELTTLSNRNMADLRGNRIGIVFQDPMTSLNPVLTVGYQLTEPLLRHCGLSKREAWTRAAEMLERVGIVPAAKRLSQYPHQFSGGQRQRIMIAMALICEPDILIADEPTTALDVTIQAQILDLMRDLRRQSGSSIILITHDLGVIAGMADRVLVMYGGQVVEEAPVDSLFATPKHPYTQGLLQSVPNPDTLTKQRLVPIEGHPPDLLFPPLGCPFFPRCSRALRICQKWRPREIESVPGHRTACWLEETVNMRREGGVNV